LFFASSITPLAFGVGPVRVAQINQIAFARPRLAGGDARVQQRHQVGPLRVVAVGRGQQAGGFVECEQVFILEQDGDFPELAGGGRREFDGRVFTSSSVFWSQSLPD
jgi:hypothetical protein